MFDLNLDLNLSLYTQLLSCRKQTISMFLNVDFLSKALAGVTIR